MAKVSLVLSSYFTFFTIYLGSSWFSLIPSVSISCYNSSSHHSLPSQPKMDQPQTESASTTPNFTCTNTRILNYKRQLSLADDALEEQKDEFVRKMNAFERREEALREKDLRLQESLIKFNKFLQENENKKARATRR